MTIQAPLRVRPGWSQERSRQQASPEVDVERLTIETIRTLAMDTVEAAGSGHPGTPLALAPLVHVLFTRYLKHDPGDPDWADRDRFVLSAGHASALLYAVLHLAGYDLPLDELRRFRQWGSRNAGHPERGVTPGVEVSTGPLGQGVANAVGMAQAEHLVAARFNRPGHEIIDHRTWVIASDGDLMEAVNGEAASLAGRLGLGKLVVFYEDNRITVEGSTDLPFSESVGRRFEAYGWQVLSDGDVNDIESLTRAIEAARADVAGLPSSSSAPPSPTGPPRSRERPPPTGRRSDPGTSTGPRSSWTGLIRSPSPSPAWSGRPWPGSAPGASAGTRNGRPSSSATSRTARTWLPNWSGYWRASCRPAGRRAPRHPPTSSSSAWGSPPSRWRDELGPARTESTTNDFAESQTQ